MNQQGKSPYFKQATAGYGDSENGIGFSNHTLALRAAPIKTGFATHAPRAPAAAAHQPGAITWRETSPS